MNIRKLKKIEKAWKERIELYNDILAINNALRQFRRLEKYGSSLMGWPNDNDEPCFDLYIDNDIAKEALKKQRQRNMKAFEKTMESVKE